MIFATYWLECKVTLLMQFMGFYTLSFIHACGKKGSNYHTLRVCVKQEIYDQLKMGTIVRGFQQKCIKSKKRGVSICER